MLLFAYCGLVGNLHLTAKPIFFAPLPASTMNLGLNGLQKDNHLLPGPNWASGV